MKPASRFDQVTNTGVQATLRAGAVTRLRSAHFAPEQRAPEGARAPELTLPNPGC
jgi:hypothetical protein